MLEDDSPPPMGLTVQCGKCRADIVNHEHVFIYDQYNSGVHFCIKPDLSTVFLDVLPEADYFKETPEQASQDSAGDAVMKDRKRMIMKMQPIQRRKKWAMHVFACAACDNQLGDICPIGPKNDFVCCFSPPAVKLVKDGVEMEQGKWPTLRPFLTKYVEVRDLVTFYGIGNADHIGDFSRPPINLVKPTVETLQHMSLRELTVDKPRPYQIECFIQAALQNTIVYLPTGAGKTLVGAMMISLMHKLNPFKTIFFVVHRVSLAYQQGQYIKDQTGLEVFITCGENVEEIPSAAKLSEVPVVVVTAQVLINWLQRKQFRLDDTSLVILDEVHNAVKAHPFVVLMKNFYAQVETKFRPLFLGLTASPTSGVFVQMHFGLRDLCNTCMASVYMPCLYWDELLQTINRPKIDFSVIAETEEMAKMNAIIGTFCGYILNRAKVLLAIDAVLIFPGLENVNSARGLIRVLSEKAHTESKNQASQMIFLLSQVLTAVEFNSVLGPRFAKSYLVEMLGAILQRRDHSWLEENDVEYIRQVISDVEQFTTASNKVEVLLNILLSCSDEEATRSRAIIFVQTKKTARQLLQILKENEVVLNRWLPAIFVGNASGQVDGMTYMEDQAPTLARFRLGQHRLLISTNVLQEGMDVPVCNRVILFDQTWSLTSFIQSRGRARAMNSAYNLICSEGEKKKYEEIIRTEKQMEDTVMQFMASERRLKVKACMLAMQVKIEVDNMVTWVPKRHTADAIGAEIVTKATFTPGKSVKNIRTVCLTFHNLPPEITEKAVEELLEDIPLADCQFTEIECESRFGRKALEMLTEVNSLVPIKLNDFYRILRDVIRAVEPHMDPLISYRLINVPRPACNDSYMIVSESLETGNLVSPNEFRGSRNLMSKIKFAISFSQKVARCFFTAKEGKIFRFDLGFSCIDGFILADTQGQHVSLVIPFKQAPLLFYAESHEIIDIKLSNMDQFAWERACADDFDKFVNFGESAAFKLDCFVKGMERDELMAVLQRLNANEDLQLYYGTVETIPSDDSRFLSAAQIEEAIEAYRGDFELLYLLKTFFSCYFTTTICRTPKTFFTTLNRLEDANRCKDFLLRLSLRCAEHRFVDLEAEMARLLEENTFDQVRKAQAPGTCPVRFVSLTPSKIIFDMPKDMMRNRILRSFNPDYFLRVHFRDEDGLKLSSVKSEASLKNLLQRVQAVLKDGLIIGGRHYEFLAMSSSQLRDHGCWFVAEHRMPDGALVSAEVIRAWCGQFDKIKNVAKYVARLGQSLSASQDTVVVPEYEFDMIEDIKVISPRAANGTLKEYTFTDGIGMISPALAQEVAAKLGMSPCPTAFQIRFAGFKGVVAINPLIDPRDPVKKMWLRDSMRKFESQHHVLEVLNTTQVIPCYLNRQVLMILSGLGVPDEAFIRLQDDMFHQMADMLVNRQEALKFLAQNYYVLPQLPFMEMTAIDPTVEPFFRSLVFAAYKRKLAELLTRSRVFLPKGRILMGTIDETGTLQPDEVFVQCQRVPDDVDPVGLGHLWDPERKLFTLQGLVTIAKNPCMHPGDVRIMRAVDVPALRRTHFDCIVFPAKGTRPITDMCSGSDLDGDLYFVTWDKSLLPPAEYPPMEYDAPKAKETDGGVKLEDVQRFMVDFIANDQLGTIANAHVAHVDGKPKGVKDELCVLLAYIFSMAVDFPKTGFIPDFPKEARVTQWPDFMQKHDQPTYASQKVIGRMFRKAKTIFFSTSLPRHSPILPDPRFLAVPGYEVYLEEARRLYREYADALAAILGAYSIKDEAQVFAGALAEAGTLRKDDLRTAIDVVKSRVRALQDSYKTTFMRGGCDGREECGKRACAWYYAAYSEPYRPVGLHAPVLSFPWINGPLLMEIAAAGAPQGGTDFERRMSVPYVIGKDLLCQSIDSMGEDYVSAYMERVQFKNLLESNIKAKLNSGDVKLKLVGSSATGVFFRSSDLNLACSPGAQLSFAQDVLPAVSEMFHVTVQNNQIQHRGKPYSFVISPPQKQDLDSAARIQFIRAALSLNPLWLCLVHPLQKWARAQGVTRKSASLAGQISSTLLTSIILTFVAKRHQVAVQPEAMAELTAEQEYFWLLSLMETCKAAMGSEPQVLMGLGEDFFAFVQFMAFSDEAAINDLVHASQCHEPISADLVTVLRELFFRGFHLICQSLSVDGLWRVVEKAAEVEQEVNIMRKPRMFKKLGVSSAVFMEGSTVLLFEGARSDLDLVLFDLYQLRRRPQHVQTQCYAPLLKEPDAFHPADLACKTYNDYFAHAVRQFDLARRTGTAEHGTLKMAIKFGRLYLTNLPKVFLEEGLSGNIENTRKALSLGYKSVGERARQILQPAAGLKLDLMRLESKEDAPNAGGAVGGSAAVPTPADIMRRHEEQEGPSDLKSLTAVIRRKNHSLTPMTSSFEPHIHSDAGALRLVQEFGFRPVGTKTGYAVSLTLFNQVTDTNADFQVIYDDHLQFYRLSERPIRWMIIDMKSSSQDSGDLRLSLTSRKDHDKTKAADDDEVLQALRTGAIEFIPDGADGRGGNNIRVIDRFRPNDRVFVRRSHQDQYQATPQTISLLQARFPSLPSDLLAKLILRFTWVAEFNEHDKESGRYPGGPVEKMELEVDVMLDWAELHQSGRVHECAGTLYQLGFLFKSYANQPE